MHYCPFILLSLLWYSTLYSSSMFRDNGFIRFVAVSLHAFTLLQYLSAVTDAGFRFLLLHWNRWNTVDTMFQSLVISPAVFERYHCEMYLFVSGRVWLKYFLDSILKEKAV